MGGSKKKKNDKLIKIKVEIVTREEWGALPPTHEPHSMEIPVSTVRFSYTNTKKDNCTSYETCSKELRAFQQMFHSQDVPDLPYNFLVGADGRVYEGRGWYCDVERHNSLKKLRRKCLDITYMGEFSRSFPPEHMFDVAADLVESGINLKLIKKLPRIESLNDYRDFLYYEDQDR